MANNYCSFSAMLPLKTKKEREWVNKAFEEIQDALDEELTGETDPATKKWARDWTKNYESLGFDTELQDEGLWIYTEESGNVDAVADFVRMFLREFHPDKFWKMTWACTCSRPKIDEFDGGALMVTADTISFMNATKWFRQMKKRTKKEEL